LNASQKSVSIIRAALFGLIALIVLLLVLAPKPSETREFRSIDDFVRVYAWLAGLLNIIPLALLALTAKWWMRPCALEAPNASPPRVRFFLPLVVGAMIVSAGVGAFRLGASVWDDEDYSVRKIVLGTYREKGDGQFKLREVDWVRTLWFYEKPTNHIFQSVLSRLSLSAWRTVARPQGLQFNEIALRLPAFIAGVLSIGSLAMLCARAGLPGAGILAAWLLAFHPWHLRLAFEARGYAFVFLLIPVCAWFALGALESGRWRWWLGLAGSEILLLWTWPPAAVVVAVLGLSTGMRIFFEPRLAASRNVLLMRLVVSQGFAGIVLLQLYLPCVPQFLAYMETTLRFYSPASWLRDVGTFFLTGSAWSKSGLRTGSPYLEYLPTAFAHPRLFATAVWMAVGFFIAGVGRFLAAGPASRWIVPMFLLPPPLLYFPAVIKDKYLWEWYMAFALPGFCALVAAGFLWIVALICGVTGLAWPRPAAAVALVLAFVALSNPGRTYLLAQSPQPFRESVLLTRPNLDPNSPENRRILTISSMGSPESYDPRVIRGRTLADYENAMREADARGIPLFVNNGAMPSVRFDFPHVAHLLQDRSVFELVATLRSFEPYLDREVLKYKPGAVRDLDFSKYRIGPEDPH